MGVGTKHTKKHKQFPLFFIRHIILTFYYYWYISYIDVYKKTLALFSCTLHKKTIFLSLLLRKVDLIIVKSSRPSVHIFHLVPFLIYFWYNNSKYVRVHLSSQSSKTTSNIRSTLSHIASVTLLKRKRNSLKQIEFQKATH